MSSILITGANRPNSRLINDIVYIYFRLKQGREDSLHIMMSCTPGISTCSRSLVYGILLFTWNQLRASQTNGTSKRWCSAS